MRPADIGSPVKGTVSTISLTSCFADSPLSSSCSASLTFGTRLIRLARHAVECANLNSITDLEELHSKL